VDTAVFSAIYLGMRSIENEERTNNCQYC